MKKIITVLISSILIIATSCLKEDDTIIEISPLEGGVITPNVGGPTQPNQVWIKLANQDIHTNVRSDWDLGFYSGDEFRVILNYSTMMAAASIETTDIDAVNQSDFQSIINQVSTTAGLLPEFIDDIYGDYFNDGTAIKEISADEDENKVYLLKLGYEIYNGNVPNYTTIPTGDFRGYKKVRILRNDENSYKIQFADLNDTEHQEVIVEKDSNYHFSFFSFKDLDTHFIQPPKDEWDLCFTVFNNVIPVLGTYIFSDFVLTNSHSNVDSYEITGDPLSIENQYNQYKSSDVNFSLFSQNDQTSIGDKWRETVSGTTSVPVIHGDRFYIIKDTENRLYKLRFISMLNDSNERGYPLFVYEEL